MIKNRIKFQSYLYKSYTHLQSHHLLTSSTSYKVAYSTTTINTQTVTPPADSNILLQQQQQQNEHNNINIFQGRENRKTPIKEKRDKYFNSPSPFNIEQDRESVERWRKSLEERKQLFLQKCNQFYQDNKETVETSSGPFSMKAKTPVNILFAYVGTGYHGLEFQTTDDQYPTLENCLERALFLSGMIIPTNFGDPTRLNWRRSSRTDKGVHSMSTIIKVNLEIDRSRMFTQEGIKGYVDLVNSFLPAALRVISMEMTKKSFDPRRQGIARTYHYIIPKKYIGTKYTIEEINNTILPMFVGNYSYHNFTLKRRTYIRPIGGSSPNQTNDQQQHNDIKLEENEEEIEDDDNDIDDGDEEDDNRTKKKKESGPEQKFVYPKDRNAEMSLFRKNPRNIRRVISFKMDENSFKVGTGEQDSGMKGKGKEEEEWVTFIIKGESFMQYQIRKIMGFVLSIANGKSDLKTLELAIHSPFSINSPIAPPNPLFLYDCSFKQKHLGDQLFQPFQITSEQVGLLKKEFCSRSLYPHLKQLNDTQQFFESFMNHELPQHRFGIENEDIDQLYNMYIDFKDATIKRKIQYDQQNKEDDK